MSKTKWYPGLIWLIVGLALLLLIPIPVLADENGQPQPVDGVWGPPPGPADLSASHLHISPQQALPNQQVDISINIGNHGEETGGRTVALYINGYLEQSQTVGVSPSSCKNVVFRVTKATPGTYEVSVEGQYGYFVVTGVPTTAITCFPGGLDTGGIVVIVVFLVALILAIVLVFSKTEAK
jgi:hypothetical protein